MVEASETLREGFAALEIAFGEALLSDVEAQDQARALGEHAALRVAALRSALAEGGPLDARRRLALEAAVRKHGAELRDALAYVELFVAAVSPAPTELDLLDVLEQRFGDRAADEGAVRVSVDAPRPASLVADRHVLGGLVEYAALIASRRGTMAARLGITHPSGGGLVVRLSPVPRNAAPSRIVLHVPPRGELPGSLELARVAARRARVGFLVDAAAGVVWIESGRVET